MVSLKKLQKLQQLQKYGNMALDAKKYIGGGQHQGNSYGSSSSHQHPPQAPHGGQQPHHYAPGGAPPRRPPGLNDPDGWFNYYDRDRSGTLDREEVVAAVVAEGRGTRDAASVRSAVYGMWSIFDEDGDDQISRGEFSKPGGLGESLRVAYGDAYAAPAYAPSGGGYAPSASNPPAYAPQAPPDPYAPQAPPPSGGAYVPQASRPPSDALSQLSLGGGGGGAWSCPRCTFFNMASKSTCGACGGPAPPSGTHQNTALSNSPPSYAPHPHPSSSHAPAPPPPTPQYTMMRVHVPAGAQAGQPLRIQVPGGSLMQITLPPRSTWKVAANGDNTVDVSVPSATAAPSASHDAPPQSTGPTITWKAFPAFKPGKYSFPPLGMRPAPSLSPHPVRPSGRRRALIIGCNYAKTRAELNGCINDAHSIHSLLRRNGYPDDSCHMVVLVDDTRDKKYKPTGKNIMKGMQWLLQGVAAGDMLFFHFSGHGSQVPDKTGMEKDGLNETILPSDYNHSQITDDELWGSLVHPLPAGANLTAIMDCCHSGTGMDLPYEYTISKHAAKYGAASAHWGAPGAWTEDANPCHSLGDVVMFSGCRDDQTSADVKPVDSKACGAMTSTFLATLRKDPHPTYAALMGDMHRELGRSGLPQKPMLTSSQKFDLQTRNFSLTEGILPNGNQRVGRDKRTHFKKVRKNSGFGLDHAALGKVALGAFVLNSFF